MSYVNNVAVETTRFHVPLKLVFIKLPLDKSTNKNGNLY